MLEKIGLCKTERFFRCRMVTPEHRQDMVYVCCGTFSAQDAQDLPNISFWCRTEKHFLPLL